MILEGGLGLTCSTFVLTLFESAGIPLADLTRWIARPGDDEQHRILIEKMRNGIPGFAPPAAAEHVARIEASLPCIRFRPVEAVAAALANELPATFELTERWGNWIYQWMSEQRVRSHR